jgi:hypothetical protein
MTQETASPRIARLIASIEYDGAAAVEAFWADIARTGAPLVEPDPDDAGGDPRDQLLTRIGETDVWYRTLRLPATLRAVYRFGPDDRSPRSRTRGSRAGPRAGAGTRSTQRRPSATDPRRRSRPTSRSSTPR